MLHLVLIIGKNLFLHVIFLDQNYPGSFENVLFLENKLHVIITYILPEENVCHKQHNKMYKQTIRLK